MEMRQLDAYDYFANDELVEDNLYKHRILLIVCHACSLYMVLFNTDIGVKLTYTREHVIGALKT